MKQHFFKEVPPDRLSKNRIVGKHPLGTQSYFALGQLQLGTQSTWHSVTLGTQFTSTWHSVTWHTVHTYKVKKFFCIVMFGFVRFDLVRKTVMSAKREGSMQGLECCPKGP